MTCYPLQCPFQRRRRISIRKNPRIAERNDKVPGRIRDRRGGKLYDAKWGVRMRADGFQAEQMQPPISGKMPALDGGQSAVGPVAASAATEAAQ